jgi:type II secretory pathway pseudopilin PulG
LEVRAIKKKRGNTLVELIAAVALIIITLQVISVAVKASSNMWTRSNMKLETSTFNQSVTQNIKNRGKGYVKSIYADQNADPGDEVVFYIYFDNFTEIAPFFEDDSMSGFNFQTDFNYTTCETNNTGKKFGAAVKIVDVKGTSDKYSLYELEVTTWNMEHDGQYSSSSLFYIGG